MSSNPRSVGFDRLTRTEIRIVDTLCRLGRGDCDPELAHILGYAPSFIHSAIGHALRKTGTFNRVQLCIAWECELFQLGLRELNIR